MGVGQRGRKGRSREERFSFLVHLCLVLIPNASSMVLMVNSVLNNMYCTDYTEEILGPVVGD